MVHVMLFPVILLLLFYINNNNNIIINYLSNFCLFWMCLFHLCHVHCSLLFVFVCCAVSVIGLLAVDSAH
jgi:hypothetical protein